MNKGFVLGISIFFATGIAQAAEVWTDYTQIEFLYPTSTGFNFITSYSNSLSTCNDGKRFTFDRNASDYNMLVSSLISAFMAGKEIQMVFSDTQPAACAVVVGRFKVAP